MRAALHPCYILHQRPYRETSLILEILSREYGKLALVAKGVKKGRRNQRALMQPNQKLNLAWVARGEMGTLTDIEAIGTNLNLKGSNLLAAYYINELLLRLLHSHEPHCELFDAYDSALRKLSAGTNEQPILRVFEKQLLESLGYGLVLDHDVISGEPINSSSIYFYQLDSGPAASPESRDDKISISGTTLIALARNNIVEEQQLKEAKRLTRQVLKTHLGNRPLASRELFRKYLDSIKNI